ncbi:MAG: SGNH/GDSL hydrolase family protein, partial [Limisphaerales bacterium]
ATNALHYFPGYFTNGQTWFLTIGDSIGIGGNGCTLTNNPQSRFFSKWAPTNFIYADNKGVVGQTAATTLANYSADTSAWKPIGGTNSIIMDQSGINDIHGGVTASNLFLTTSNICRLAHADGFKIIVNQLYPYANISGAELANLTDYNQMLEKVPGMWDYLFAVNYVLPAPPNEDCYSDHIHPNQRGNESIARELDALLRCGLYNKWPKQPCPSSAPSGVVRGPADRGESESWFMQGATGTGYRMLITGDAGSFSGQHMDFDGVVYNYAHNGSGSIAGADIFETATPSTSILSVANSWTLSLTGDFRPTKTITAGGTTGAQVINKTSGSVNFAAAATTLTVADSLVTTSSVIICTIASNDTTAKSACVVAASGTFTITLNAAATAETRVNFFVTN